MTVAIPDAINKYLVQGILYRGKCLKKKIKRVPHTIYIIYYYSLKSIEPVGVDCRVYNSTGRHEFRSYEVLNTF